MATNKPPATQVVTDVYRGTGRTVACALDAIALALRCPQQWVTFVDHCRRTSRLSDMKEYLEQTVESLSLEMEVRQNKVGDIQIRSLLPDPLR